MTDFAKFDHPEQLHLFWQAMDLFYCEEKRFPSVHAELVPYVMKIKFPDKPAVSQFKPFSASFYDM